MNIRAVQQSDFERIRQVYDAFFSDEFEFPDFLSNYLCAFVVEDSDQRLIAAAGVRTLAEVVAITNKDRSTRERRQALLEILKASAFTCSIKGYDQIHAFVQDYDWLRHLFKVGFRTTAGESLVFHL
jgi:hypothetical protein